MIMNERQYRITKAQADRFRQSIKEARSYESTLSPRMRQAVLDGMRSQLDDLEREIDQYDSIRDGRLNELELESLADLPKLLIVARIAARMTQADLANRIGIHEQQIQRYESNDYSGASLSRLIEITDALNLRISGTARFAQPVSEVSPVPR